jgi:hypothetical protein
MINEKILEILYQLGFQPELVDENFGYRFEYEGLTILYTPEDEDAHTVCFMIPGIFDISDDNRVAVLEAMVKLAGRMKFVQPVIMSDSVWLNYQHFLSSQEPTPEVLEHMIRVLAVSTIQFHKFINNEGNDE